MEVRYYLSSDSVITDADFYIGNSFITLTSFGGIFYDAKKIDPLSSIGPITLGSYHIGVIIPSQDIYLGTSVPLVEVVSTCPDDNWEPNNSCRGNSIAVGGPAYSQEHCNVDWKSFTPMSGATYRIQTTGLSRRADTVMSISKECGSLPLNGGLSQITDDNGGSEPLSSMIEYTADSTDVIDIEISEFGDDYHSGKSYSVFVECIANCSPLASLAINGVNQVNENSSRQLFSTATLEDGSSQNVTTQTNWSENSNFASITSSGLLTAQNVTGNQSVTVSASYTLGNITKSDIFNITIVDLAPTLSNLTIAGITSVDENTAAQYSATATFSDGSNQVVNSLVNWSENSNFSSISSSGLLTAAPNVTSNQPVRVTASYTVDGVTRSDTHDITIKNIDPVLTDLSISGVNTVNEGDMAQYMATATLSDNTTPNVTISANWSEDSTVATINSTGLFTVDSDSGNQQVTITASYTHEEVTIADTFAVTVLGSPNIAPYQPIGWSNKIVVSNVIGTTVNSLSLGATDSLYVDWAIANIGGAEAAAVNSTYAMYLDNVFLNSWSNIGAIPPVSTSGTYLQITDIPIGPLTDGVHTLRLVADSNNTITEGNESDNEYTLIFTVNSSVVCMLPNLSIPDNNFLGIDSIITVSSGGTVDDIGVKLISNHTNPGDLTVSLTFNGTNVVLMDRPGVPERVLGCSSADINTIFDGSSISPVESECGNFPGIGGFVLPEQGLSNFDGMSLNGDWILNIFDNASGNTGNLEAWCLYTTGGPLIFVDGYEKSKVILPIPPNVTL